MRWIVFGWLLLLASCASVPRPIELDVSCTELGFEVAASESGFVRFQLMNAVWSSGVPSSALVVDGAAGVYLASGGSSGDDHAIFAVDAGPAGIPGTARTSLGTVTLRRITPSDVYIEYSGYGLITDALLRTNWNWLPGATKIGFVLAWRPDQTASIGGAGACP
jgi:hypothetical protein